LCLLDEALYLSDHRLLLFRQLTISYRSQAALRAPQALINRRVILALLLGCQNVAETWRLAGLGLIGLPRAARLARPR
jgi:hypothetical protein